MKENVENVEESPKSTSSSSISSRPPTPRTPPSEQFLQYGDIIQLFTHPVVDTPSSIHADLNEKTFLVDYVDDDKIRIVNTTTFDTILLHMDDEGQLKEPSIRRIDLLTRAKEPGFARQKGLLPDQWIDIFFIGIEEPLTGKITRLDEDQIEVTLHPSQELIYIDFSYRGIPEELGIERFVLRSIPSSATTKKQPKEGEELGEEGEREGQGQGTEEEEEEGEEEKGEGHMVEASIEYTPENEMILRLPEEGQIVYDETINERLEKEYLNADEIIFGSDMEHVEKYVEEMRYEMVFNIDTQLTSLMNELLSHIPDADRTHRVTNDVHRLLDRFRELREQYSLMDTYTHKISGARTHGDRFKPLADYLVSQTGVPISWLLPVTQTRRVLYYLPTNDETAEDLGESLDTEIRAFDVEDLQSSYENYNNNTVMNRVANPYQTWINELEPYFQPTVTTPIPSAEKSILFTLTVPHDRWESVIDNRVDKDDDDFTATAMKIQRNFASLAPTHMAFQRFNDCGYFLKRSENNPRMFTQQRLNVDGGDTMAIQSWITLPTSVVHFSKIYMPSLDMMQRSSMSNHHWLKYRSFPSDGHRGRRGHRSQPDIFMIDDTTKNFFSSKTSRDTNDIKIHHYLKGIQQFVLDKSVIREHAESMQMEDLYRDYVQSMLPSTFDLVEIIQSHWTTPFQGLNLRNVLSAMEPFKIYLGDLTYLHLNRIRYFMKERTRVYKTEFMRRRASYLKLDQTYHRLSANATQHTTQNIVQQLLEQGTLYDIFMDAYRMSTLQQSSAASSKPTSSTEIIQTMIRKDMGSLFANLVRNATMHNIVSDMFLKAVEEEQEPDEGEGGDEKKNRMDCNRYSLTKRYTSLEDLQKDNHRADIYYDKEFDDTPYDLMKEYLSDLPDHTTDVDSDEMKEFMEKLSIILVKKHGVDREHAADLARTLVAKQKLVKEGEYALLDVNDTREMYKRMKNQWVHDSEVDEESFAQLAYLVNAAFPSSGKKSVNQMLCDTQPSCMKNPRTSMCESVETSKHRIQLMRQQYAVKEMEKRLDMSQDELAKLMEQLILSSSRSLAARERLKAVLDAKYSLAAYAMGKLQMQEQRPIVVSPHAKLLSDIMGQDDFAEKQHRIVALHDKEGIMRKAMVEQMGENIHWFYCIKTNVKLMPVFLYNLAKGYTSNGREGYQEELEQTKKFQYTDGNTIYDKQSGFAICHIDDVDEVEFDDNDKPIQKGGKLVIEPSSSSNETNVDTDAYARDVARSDRLKPILIRGSLEGDRNDTEISMMVKNIFATFCNVMDITPKEYERGEFKTLVIRLAMEFIDEFIQPEDMNDKKYYHQYVVILTTSAFLIGVQTTNPPIHIKKTVPGCVKSFSGYPMTESIEDQSGIQYLTCILNLVRSSIPPWNSLQKVKKETISKKLQEMISLILEKRPDIVELYVKHRVYRAEHPHEFALPEVHKLEKWLTLLPPVVPIDIVSRLTRERPPIEPVRGNVESQLIRYGYGIIETIHHVVRSKDVLLKTAMGIPYIHNACCNEQPASAATKLPESTLAYFIREAPILRPYLDHMAYFQQYLELQQRRHKPAMMVFSDDTRIQRAEVTSGNQEEIVYAAFIHFCHFDRLDVDIPEYLLPVCATKPADDKYNRRGTLAEKIQSLKHMGRTFLWEDFEQLIRRVNLSNRIVSDFQFTPPSAVKVLTEFLAIDRHNEDEGEDTSNPSPKESIIDPFRNELLAVLTKYDPQIMVLEQSSLYVPEEDTLYAAINDLKNVVGPRNNEMTDAIVKFLRDKRDKETAIRIMDQLTQWSPHLSNKGAMNHEELYEMSQFIQNAIVYSVKVLPDMIYNNQFVKEVVVPKHWKLSEKHNEVIQIFLRKMYDWFATFSTENKKTPSYNKTFLELLRSWQTRTFDIVRLVQLIPIQLPIQKGGQTFFRLFPLDTIILLMKHLYLSLLNEMVKLCDEVLPKTMEGTQVRNMSIRWVMALLDMWNQDKDMIDLSYEDIMKKVNKSRESEKKRIIDEFDNANNTDRRYMYIEKLFKIGKWNVDSKDVFKYSARVFEKELAEFVDNDTEEGGGDEEEDEEEGEPTGEGEEGYDFADENEYSDDEGDEDED